MKTPTLRDFRDLIGVPFMWGGRDPRIGLDCWGLFMEAERRFGVVVPDVDMYCAHALRIHKAAEGQIAALWRRVDGPAPGVGVVMATDHGHPGILQHFGVCLDARNVLHSQQNTGSVLDRLDILQGALCVKGFSAWNGR